MPNYYARLLLPWSGAWKSARVKRATTEALIPSLREGGHQQQEALAEFKRLGGGRRKQNDERGEGRRHIEWSLRCPATCLCSAGDGMEINGVCCRLLVASSSFTTTRHKHKDHGRDSCPHETLVDCSPAYRAVISISESKLPPWSGGLI